MSATAAQAPAGSSDTGFINPNPQQILQEICNLRIGIPSAHTPWHRIKAWTSQLESSQKSLFLYEDLFTADELREARVGLFCVLTEANIPASGYVYDFLRFNYEVVLVDGGVRTLRHISGALEKIDAEDDFIFSIPIYAQCMVFGCSPLTYTEQVRAIKEIAHTSGFDASSHVEYICMCLNEQAYNYEHVQPASTFSSHKCKKLFCKKIGVSNGAQRIAFVPEAGSDFERPQSQTAPATDIIRWVNWSVFQFLELYAIENSILAQQALAHSGNFHITKGHHQSWGAQVRLVIEVNDVPWISELRATYTALTNVPVGQIVLAKRIGEQDARASVQDPTQDPHGTSHNVQTQASLSSSPQSGPRSHENTQEGSQTPCPTLQSRALSSESWRGPVTHAGASSDAGLGSHMLKTLLENSVADDEVCTLSLKRRVVGYGRPSA